MTPDPIDPSAAPAGPPEPRVSVLMLYRQMWAYAAGARGWLLLSSVMLVASQLVKLLMPWLTAQAINTLQRGQAGAVRACLPWVAGIVGVYVVGWALHGPGRVIERTVSLRVRRALTDKLYVRLSEAPLSWHGTHHPAELAHRLSQAAGALTNFTQSQFIYLQNAVNLAGPLTALWLLSHLTGASALAGLGVVALTIVAFDRAMMRLANEENRAERAHAAALLDCLTNITTVLSLRLQQTTRRLLARRLDAIVEPLQRSITLLEWKWCAVDLLGVLLSWGLVALYAWRTSDANGALLLGGVFMVYQYAQQAGGVIGTLASNLQNFSRMRTDFASAAPIWAAPHERLPEHLPEPASAPPLPVWRHLEVCALSYTHPGSGPAHAQDAHARGGLHELSLRLHAGERVALVGPSGSGKSTLLRVLAGLCEPSHGHLEFDGRPAHALRDLRRAATLIPQEAQVFEASLRENVAFDLGHSDAEIHAAARVASLDSVIKALPQGLATPIKQGGSNLSGGQRQRLCLTRGVLAAQGSSLLLLDEPTSALDQITEGEVYERIRAAFPSACVVASVHRMSLLDRFDRVVLIVHGRIVDSGTADELAERQALFREMIGTAGEVEEVV
ncbi:MAG TPA: ABC transporter ATP-binding protein [Burkholderiaceae bacterium]|jgi:ABC-type multidrug transport system fused ATPase/permease subunit